MVDSAFNICDGRDFVMGDNRNDSYEAKYWDNKIVYGKMILEVVLFRYWPIMKQIK